MVTKLSPRQTHVSGFSLFNTFQMMLNPEALLALANHGPCKAHRGGCETWPECPSLKSCFFQETGSREGSHLVVIRGYSWICAQE